MTTRLKKITAGHHGGRGKPPVPRCGAPGFDGDRDQDSPRRRHRNWLLWLRPFLQKLAGGSQDKFELYLAVATGQIDFERLAELWQTTRQSAMRWWDNLLKQQYRKGWFTALSAAAIQELLRTGRVAAVRPFSIELTEHPPIVTVLPGCERRSAPEVA